MVRDEDERLRQAIRVGNIGIFEHDHDADVIFWSLELRQLYGWDSDEPATLPKILSHVHPDDADRVVAAVKRAHNPEGDGAFDIEHRIIDRRGGLRWVLTRSRTHFGSVSGKRRALRTIGAVQDVTDRRTRRGAAARSRHRPQLQRAGHRHCRFAWNADIRQRRRATAVALSGSGRAAGTFAVRAVEDGR